ALTTCFFSDSRSSCDEAVSSKWIRSGATNNSTRAFQSRSFVSDTRNRWDGQFGFFEQVYLMTLILGVLEETEEYLACIAAEHTAHFSRSVAMYSWRLVLFRLAAIFC